MDVTFDDEAVIPPAFTVPLVWCLNRNSALPPQLFGTARMTGGVWTLDLRDDLTNANGGTLTGWSITICEPPPPVCPAGYESVTLYSQDSRPAMAAIPSTAASPTSGAPPITTCASGVNCWATDLDNTYDFSSNQDLVSPAIDPTNADLVGPATVYWSQRYQTGKCYPRPRRGAGARGRRQPTNL